jgi:hypothetical protein
MCGCRKRCGRCSRTRHASATTRIISAVKSVSKQTGRSMAQVALAWLRYQTVPVIPIIWSAEGISTPRQSREFGYGTLRRTIEIPRWGKPNRARIPPGYLRERNGSCHKIWRHVGSLGALSAVKSGCSGGKVMANELTLSVNGAKQVVSAAPETP